MNVRPWLAFAAVLALAATSCSRIPNAPLDRTAAPAGPGPAVAERGADDQSSKRGSGGSSGDDHSSPGSSQDDREGVTFSDSVATVMAPLNAGGDWECGGFRVKASGGCLPDGGSIRIRADRVRRVLEVTDASGNALALSAPVEIRYDLNLVDGAEQDEMFFSVLQPNGAYTRVPDSAITRSGHWLRMEVPQLNRIRVQDEGKAGWRDSRHEVSE